MKYITTKHRKYKLDNKYWGYNETVCEKIFRKMELKGITKEKHIILYDVNREDAFVVAEYLRDKGIDNLYYFNFENWEGETEWCPHYERLVPSHSIMFSRYLKMFLWQKRRENGK